MNAPPHAEARSTGRLLATFTAIVATIVETAMVAAGGWSLHHAVRLTFWWPTAPAQIVRDWITRGGDDAHGQRFFHVTDDLHRGVETSSPRR